MARILIADDDANFREVIRMEFSGAGFEVSEADNGEKAVAIAKELKPDLILMDVNMPGKLNGVEAAFAIKSDPETQNIRIAFLSGSEDPWPGLAGEKSSVSKAIGMEDFIPKTTELPAILARVQILLATGIPIPVPTPPPAA